jgi:3-hydroxyisobutyrate dehydrogenase-like beta-hydroxyacid dehydrogenase
MTASVKIAIIGLGETSASIANGLKLAGANIVGFDSVKPKYPPIPLADTLAVAVADADLVVSLNSPMASVKIAEETASHLKPGAVFADLNTSTPSLKRKLASVLPVGSFADVAIMGSARELAERVPMLVSGEGAENFIELMALFGLNLEYVSNQPGEAAARKLLKSILDKGMAALLSDTLWAAKAMGLEDWAIAEITRELSSANEGTVQRLINETGKNPKRGSVEMGDVVEMLAEAGYESTMANGISLTLSHIMHGRKIPFANLSED